MGFLKQFLLRIISRKATITSILETCEVASLGQKGVNDGSLVWEENEVRFLHVTVGTEMGRAEVGVVVNGKNRFAYPRKGDVVLLRRNPKAGLSGLYPQWRVVGYL